MLPTWQPIQWSCAGLPSVSMATYSTANISNVVSESEPPAQPCLAERTNPPNPTFTINKVGLINIEGLKTQASSSVPYIGDILSDQNMLFLMITETWLRNHLDAELGVTGYSLFRTDRDRPKKRRGRNSGGVAIYMRDDLAASCEVLLQHSSGVIEALCLRIRRLNIIVCVVYRQPDDLHGGNRSTAVEFQSLINSLSRTLNDLPSPTPDILVTGDFNLPRVAWPQSHRNQALQPTERKWSKYFMTEFFFSTDGTRPDSSSRQHPRFDIVQQYRYST